MKRLPFGLILFIIIFNLLPGIDYAQKYSVKNPYNNAIYKGMQTPLEPMVEGFSCKSIILKASIGKIEKEICNFLFYPNKLGIDTITVLVIKNGITRKVGYAYFDVREIPDPEPNVGGLSKGAISKGFLIAQQGVDASLIVTSYGHRESIVVDSFTLIILRNKNIIFSGNNNGNIFNHSLRTAFESLQKGDKVIVADIAARTYNSTVTLRPIEFAIK
jgi:GldM C-terminal domain